MLNSILFLICRVTKLASSIVLLIWSCTSSLVLLIYWLKKYLYFHVNRYHTWWIFLACAPSTDRVNHVVFILAEVSPLKTARRLGNPLIHNGRIYACSGKSLLVFESNGTVAWIIPLGALCRLDITPVGDERGKVIAYLIFRMILLYVYLEFKKSLLFRGNQHIESLLVLK